MLGLFGWLTTAYLGLTALPSGPLAACLCHGRGPPQPPVRLVHERQALFECCRRNTAELIAYQEGKYGSYEYGRYGNPTTKVCEDKLSALEGGESCLLSASGMNTATTMLLALVPAGKLLYSVFQSSAAGAEVQQPRSCSGPLCGAESSSSV